ncbi:MAG: cell division protein FtsQ/DivIB [Tissierellaceae bacterium]|jgi:cell division protein FtsQ
MRASSRIEKKHKRFKRLVSLILIISILTILLVFLLNSNYFNIDKITIKGNEKITKEKLLHTSSINFGENIFRISTRQAEESIRKLPYVKTVKIRRELPRTISIEVVEREEKVLLKDISMYYILDEEGYLLGNTDSNNDNLPVILGLKTERIDPGDNLFANMEVKELEDLIKESEYLNLLKEIEAIEIENQKNVNILINNGINVAFGPLSNVKYKVGLLSEIFNHSKENEIEIREIIMNRGEHPIIVTDN